MDAYENVYRVQRDAMERVEGLPFLMALEVLIEDTTKTYERAQQVADRTPSVSTIAARAFTEGIRLAATLAHSRTWEQE